MQTYQLGTTTIDITPPVGVFLSGFAAREGPSTGTYHPLRAVASIISDGESRACLVSAEWLGFYDRAEEAREQITEATGIEAGRIFLFGSHTHYGPSVRRDIDTRRKCYVDEEYVAGALDAMAKAAASASEKMEAVQLSGGRGWCGFAASRREPDGEGGIRWSPSLDAPHDHEGPIIVAKSESGELRQILFSYACHPTSGGGTLNETGGDYPGFALEHLDLALPGSSPAFLLGCAGDQKPNAVHPDKPGFRPLEVEETKGLGDQLGRAVVRTIESDDLRPISGDLRINQQMLALEFDAVDDEMIEESLQASSKYVREWAEHLASLEELPESIPFEVQTLALGDSFALIALSGEITVEYALRLKRELGARYENVLVLGYANHIIGYVPVKRQIPEGGYEVIGSNQHMFYPGPFAAETEEQICAAVHGCLG